jgi:hypothetical protein
VGRDERRAPRAWLLGLTLIASAASACGGDVREYVERFDHPTLPAIDIHLSLSSHQQRYHTRYLNAVRAALNRLGEWYGPYPGDKILLGDSDAVHSTSSSGSSMAVPAQTLSPGSSLKLEEHVCSVVARAYWLPPGAPDLTRDAALREAVIAFSVDRLIREVYSEERPVELRFFAETVPWVVRGVRGSPPLAAERMVLALITLERYLGWSTLQQSLADWRTRNAGAPTSAEGLIAVASDLTGRDLSWMNGLFDPSQSYDYGVDRIDRPDGASSIGRVEVVVKRYGTGEFTGSAMPRKGGFESGRGVTLTVAFADGQEMVESWDGRDVERRFVYESPVAVVSAVVDPDNVIAVDTARANNELHVGNAPAMNREAGLAWTLRWGTWLQDRLLLWSALF